MRDNAERPSDDVGILGELVGYRLKRAYSAFLTDFARALAGTQMRQALFGILALVAGDPGAKQGEIGRRLGIKRANMVALVNELSERRLVERRAANGDRRALALYLTPEGEAMLELCRARIAKQEQKMLAPFSPAERRMLVDLLTRLAP